jgi:uncharacterized membrane protein (DUF485 family)
VITVGIVLGLPVIVAAFVLAGICTALADLRAASLSSPDSPKDRR